VRERLLEHVMHAIERAPMRTFPFPHEYVESVFPADDVLRDLILYDIRVETAD